MALFGLIPSPPLEPLKGLPKFRLHEFGKQNYAPHCSNLFCRAFHAVMTAAVARGGQQSEGEGAKLFISFTAFFCSSRGGIQDFINYLFGVTREREKNW